MFDLLRSAGIATVVPSGNEGNPFALAYPACISSAVSVGGTYGEDQIAGFQTAPFPLPAGPGLVFAQLPSRPGELTCEYAGPPGRPHVAGAWAVLKQAVPEASVDEILAVLQSTVSVTDPETA
jgi:hypothetical protein